MFNLDEEMKKLKERGPNNPISLDKMAAITAAALDRFASHQALVTFNDKRFRELAHLEKLEQLEQDRILNELVLAAVVLLMLTFESPDLRIPDEIKDYFLKVKQKIPQAHLDQLAEYGIEKKYLEDWKKLIQMRYDEYSEDKIGIREAAMEVESKEKDLTTKDLEEITLILPVQAVAFGCHHHTCRGRTDGYEDLARYLVRWLGRYYTLIRAQIEVGQISPATKLKIKLRHLLNDHFRNRI